MTSVALGGVCKIVCVNKFNPNNKPCPFYLEMVPNQRILRNQERMMQQPEPLTPTPWNFSGTISPRRGTHLARKHLNCTIFICWGHS